jgi:glycosyltransferase involved in cell wall biosynthesis
MSEVVSHAFPTAPAAPARSDAPLRILVVTVAAGGIGGMQRHTHDLVRGLVAAGHDVEVFCPNAEGLEPDLYGARWTLLDTVARGPEWPGLILEAYRAGAARAPFDVVHSESTSALPLVLARVPTPVAVKYHGNYLGLAKAHLRRAASRPSSAHKELRALAHLTRRHFRGKNWRALGDCESMVVSRQQLVDTARSHRIRRELVHVVPNGVDLTVFRPADPSPLRRALELPPGPIAIAVGRLNREKGFDVAIDAFAEIADRHPEARLVIVGNGEERTVLEELAERRGLAGRTIFAGPQPQERVAEHLAAADVFLFPTRRDEAGPLVLPQAMGCGLAVVASRIGGITEVLEPPDGDPLGFLVPPGDVAAVASAVDWLFRSPESRRDLGSAARLRAEREYGLETMVSRTVAVYRSAIARAAVGSRVLESPQGSPIPDHEGDLASRSPS